MKVIRYLASFLFLLTAILHVRPIIFNASDHAALPMLGFGIVYFVIGVLLFFDNKISKYLGLIFPLIGLAIGFFVVGVKKWTAMHIFTFTIDGVIVLCCCFLILAGRKPYN